MRPDPKQVIASITKIASLPDVCIKFSAALRDPKTSNRELEEVLSEDVAMAARVLRIANSAMYSFPSRVDTVSQAATVIGYKQLNDIVLACSIINMFKGLPQDVVDMESFWRHSISCAVAARIIASHRRVANIEQYFTAGLLHDIGRLVIFVELPHRATEILSKSKRTNAPMYKLEQEVLGFDHAKLGGILLKSWKLPKRLVDSVAYHHAPARTHDYMVESSVIHVADIICHALKYGESGERFVPDLSESAWESLGLSIDVVSPVLDQVKIQAADVVKSILQDA
ncbi:HDOD domain-containing protein [Sulfuriflexus mobilis]|uniref:HDOD domain-containing protein n=1 Tax=Sulfuriflexus mobilis TaxID=1811807 RepID=UPI0015586FE0|nr:HDOD domain-containing protein [Sulfuriflexus mobilis]